MSKSRNIVTDTSGATAIEYGLIAALIAVVVVTALTAIPWHKKPNSTTPPAASAPK